MYEEGVIFQDNIELRYKLDIAMNLFYNVF